MLQALGAGPALDRPVLTRASATSQKKSGMQTPDRFIKTLILLDFSGTYAYVCTFTFIFGRRSEVALVYFTPFISDELFV